MSDEKASMKYDDCKRSPDIYGRLRYRLRYSHVWVTDFGFHHTGYLDAIADDPELSPDVPLDERLRHQVEHDLQFNRQWYEHQVELVKARMPLTKLRVLDVGCGGGLFLSLLQQQGAETVGLELQRGRAKYAQTVHGLHVEIRPVESHDIQNRYREYFDAVTLWDVIEHVNHPQDTLAKVNNLLKPGGYLFIDTPCRDSFYHRFGELSYTLSGGEFHPTNVGLKVAPLQW